jgi:exopolyphosphatase / guanosine-5'-triphosphate,3'-diphosphate pyrophosphatase
METTMDKIIARWEWRTFGYAFGVAEEKIKTYPAKVRESSEVYILSARSMDNTKIRDMLMDIKSLVQVNDKKLEQWNPLMKAGFPIQPDQVRKTVHAWKVDVPETAIVTYTYDEFLSRLVGSHPDLKMVHVYKERHGFTINNCIVEIANLKFDNEPIRTVAVEHENPDLVWETVCMLGLESFENINYLKALKKFAAIP